MGAKHGIWCCRALHQWKMFLPIQGRTLTHASILVKSLARSYVASIVMGLGGICGDPIYDKWGIVVIHYGNITPCPLGYEANHLVRTMVTYLPPIGRETPQL